MSWAPGYFFAISLDCVICILWSVRRADELKRSRKLALDIGLALMIFGFLGGRAFHVLYEDPDYYWAHPAAALRFWQGGFVFYGGAIAAALAGAGVVRWHGERFAEWADFFAPIGALAYAIGRVACWFTGCCYGRICLLPSGVAFRFPTQALAIATEAGTLAILLAFERRRPGAGHPSAWRPGTEFALWVVLHALGRIAMEAFRGDDRGPQPLGLSIGTWISLALALGGLMALPGVAKGLGRVFRGKLKASDRS